jgi:hypothetical protein
MNTARTRTGLVFAVTAVAALSSSYRVFGHGGGILVQAQDSALVIGHDAEDGSGTTMGVRAFTALMPSTLAWDSPSFISFSTPPDGTQALPSLTDVDWDFLPMTSSGVTSNLLYWDGQGTSAADVEFGPVPQAGITMTLYGRNFEPATVDGAPDMVRGKTINQTLAAGSALRLHGHRFFVLDDGDGSETTAPPVGVYLVALQLRMQGFAASDPFYIAFGIPGTSLTALDSAALPWMLDRVDSLIKDGDYDFDGDVDDADYATWRAQFGSSGPFPISGDYADGNRNGTVDAADYVFWRHSVTAISDSESPSGNAPAAANSALRIVPEPSTLMLLACAAAAGLRASFLRNRRRTETSPTACPCLARCRIRCPPGSLAPTRRT